MGGRRHELSPPAWLLRHASQASRLGPACRSAGVIVVWHLQAGDEGNRAVYADIAQGRKDACGAPCGLRMWRRRTRRRAGRCVAVTAESVPKTLAATHARAGMRSRSAMDCGDEKGRLCQEVSRLD